MGQKDLEVLYEDLLDFGIMIDKSFLKCMDQLMQVLAMLTMLVIHSSSFSILLRCLYER